MYEYLSEKCISSQEPEADKFQQWLNSHGKL